MVKVIEECSQSPVNGGHKVTQGPATLNPGNELPGRRLVKVDRDWAGVRLEVAKVAQTGVPRKSLTRNMRPHFGVLLLFAGERGDILIETRIWAA
jgi:hypothetical protein